MTTEPTCEYVGGGYVVLDVNTWKEIHGAAICYANTMKEKYVDHEPSFLYHDKKSRDLLFSYEGIWKQVYDEQESSSADSR